MHLLLHTYDSMLLCRTRTSHRKLIFLFYILWFSFYFIILE